MRHPEIVPRWIDSAAAVAALCERAAMAGCVAVDTEADSFHSYHHKLCLVQLSINGEHALVDPLAVGVQGLAPLAAVLADRAVVKLMHGADYDVRVLDRDLSSHLRTVRDTQLAARLLGEPATGLAGLVGTELGVALDKRFQRADWGKRPLSSAEMAYAAADTAFLAPLAELLEGRLREAGRHHWWLEECEALEDVRWSPPAPDPLAFARIKGARALRDGARDRLAALHAWRERVAEATDVPPFRVVRNDVLVALAAAAPGGRRELAEVKGLPRSVIRRHGDDLLALIAAPPPAPPSPRRRGHERDEVMKGRVKQLRTVRDAAAAELGLDPGALAPRGVLEAVAAAGRASAEALPELLGRRWRAEVLAAVILPITAQWPADDAESR